MRIDLARAWHLMIERVQNTTDAPNMVLPNDAELLEIPRWVLMMGASASSANSLDNDTDNLLELVVRVETILNGFYTDHLALVQRLVDRFPPGLLLGTNEVRIEEAPNPRAPFEGAGVYVTPVIIRGRCVT